MKMHEMKPKMQRELEEHGKHSCCGTCAGRRFEPKCSRQVPSKPKKTLPSQRDVDKMTPKSKRMWLKTPCRRKKCRGWVWSHRGLDNKSMKETRKWGLARAGRDVNDLHLRWNRHKSEGVSKERLGDLK